MKAAIALLVLVPATASADWNYRTGHEDKCPSVVIGRCGAFAAGWHPPMLRLELGPVMQRTLIGPMVGTEEDGTPSGRLVEGSDLAGRGVGGRIVAGFRGYYLPMDLAVTRVDGPAVVPVDMATRAIVPGGSSSGWNVSMRMGFGKELRLGRVMLGGELGLGLGVVTLGDLEAAHVHDPRLLLDARAHAGLWLTPHVSVSGFASTSFVRENERMFGLALGLSLFPWDGID